MAPATRALMRARFEREAEVAARIDHPGICSVHEFGEDDGVLWIAMRLVEGESLRSLIKRRRCADFANGDTGESVFGSTTIAVTGKEDAADPDHAFTRQAILRSSPGPAREEIGAIVSLIESASRALHAAHEAGLVHRDVKPGNLMATREGEAVVLDFGLAADDRSTGPNLTQTGDFIGTPAYMAPEQIAGGHHVDRRSDVYALGATLYECLSLCPAFEAATREALYRKIRLDDPPPLRDLNPQISRDLAVVVAAAMEKDPDRRYQSAAEFADDLRRVLAHEPILARPAGPLLRISRWTQRDPAVATMVATLVIFAAIFSGWTTLKNRELGSLNRDLGAANSSLQQKTKEAQAHAAEARREVMARDRALLEKSAALDREREARERAQKARADRDKVIAEYERMADLRRLDEAREAADTLWPIGPQLESKLLAWQGKYGPLGDRLESHRRALAELRSKALPYAEELRRRDFAEELVEIERLDGLLSKVAHLRATGMSPEEARAIEDNALKIEKKYDELRRVAAGRRSYQFGDDVETRFRHDVLARLVKELEDFVHPHTGTTVCVAKRLEDSRRIKRETIDAHAEEWKAVRERVARAEVYAGFESKLEAQLGLIPLGADPVTGLEEFLHWASHPRDLEVPQRDDAGVLNCEERTGLVFVLVPGGHFLMGAQADRPRGDHYDELASSDESPLTEIELAPFLVSKFEMTQAQWLTLSAENPSYYDPGSRAPGLRKAIDLRHPVEQVSWRAARDLCRRHALSLPTEAQWEYAARAGGRLRFPGTDAIAALSQFANVAGVEFRRYSRDHTPEHRDEYLIHAPVGSFAPNAWGLYDLSGNVFEWCEDRKGRYELPAKGPRGRRSPQSVQRVTRGGAFDVSAARSRLTHRTGQVESVRSGNLGLRPTRTLE
jgi:formylglycine-generating enzyme required for sulfatase activity/serine/threonine protein kinase